MIEWLTLASVTCASVAGVMAIVSGIRGNPPRDLTVLGTLSLVGNPVAGDAAEFWFYLITALAMSLGVTLWALVDRTRFATIGMGIVSLSIAVMIVRMSIIWAGA
jgi:hypothetical protein